MTENLIFTHIQSILNSNDIVLFMKGTKDMPMCGFSGIVTHILRQHGVEFKDINVLDNFEIREGIKEYANWPTLPQLYIRGEFIGGCDIVREMNESGELSEVLRQKGIHTSNALDSQ